jgi:hypothetical protein
VGAYPEVRGVQPVHEVGYVTRVVESGERTVVSIDRIQFHFCTQAEAEQTDAARDTGSGTSDCLNDTIIRNDNSRIREYSFAPGARIIQTGNGEPGRPRGESLPGTWDDLMQFQERSSIVVAQLDAQRRITILAEAFHP